MHSNQILVVIIIVVLILLLLILIGWGWWSEQSNTKVDNLTYKELLALRHRLDDNATYTREYSLELAEGSAGADATAKQLDANNLAIAKVLTSNSDDATKLAGLLTARQLLLKRTQSGEADSTVGPDLDKNNDALIAALNVKTTDQAYNKIKDTLSSYSAHTTQQQHDFANKDYAKSFATYELVKKDTQDLFDWFYAYVIRNKKN